MRERDSSVPREVLILGYLHNIGVTSPNRSLTLEEISIRTALEAEIVRENIMKLIKGEYVNMIRVEGVERYYVTPNGILKAAGVYS